MTTENLDAVNSAGQPAPEGNATDVSNQAAPSLEDSLRSSFRSLTAEGGEGEGEAGADAQPTARTRGPDGKFVAAEKPADKPVEGQQPATPDKPVSVNTNPDNLFRVSREGAKTPVDITKAPESWRTEAKAVFETLPEWAKREVHKREQDNFEGIRGYQEAAGFGQQMAQELLPFQEIMQQHGHHPRDVVKALLPAYKTLAMGSPQEKANLVLQLIKEHGIDFNALGTDPQQGTAQQTQEDPRIAALTRELTEIKGTLTAQERLRAEAEYNSNVEVVNKFGSDPAHEHFSAVRETMAGLIRSGQAKDLQDAYDKAIWIVPEVRTSLLAKQEKERSDKAAAEAAAARKAAGANVTRRGTPPVKPTTGAIEDTLRARFRELTGA